MVQIHVTLGSMVHKDKIHHDQLDFIPGKHGWVNISKSSNIIQNNNKSKAGNMIISINIEKTFNKL